MDFNSDDIIRILKGLDLYLDHCLDGTKDNTLPKEDQEYYEVEASEVEELIVKISS